MDYSACRTLMKKYLSDDILDSQPFENLFNDDILIAPPLNNLFVNGNISILLEPVNRKKPHLHKCIELVIEFPVLNDYLKEYVKLDGVDINETDYRDWTALHVAADFYQCGYYNDVRKIVRKTIKILIGAGANVNLQIGGEPKYRIHRPYVSCSRIDPYSMCTKNYLHHTPLHIMGHISNKKIYKIFIDAGADIFDIVNEYGEAVYNFTDKELIEHFGIDKKTKTIAYLCSLGKNTKPAIKKI